MYRAYQVEFGDTMESIAQKNGFDVAYLRQINGNNLITPGSLIVLPTTNDLFETYTVRKGDTIYQIATQYGIPYQQLLLLNGLNVNDFIYPDQEIIVPKQNTAFYITTDYDTIKTLREKFNNRLLEVLEQNENIQLVPDQLIVFKKER